MFHTPRFILGHKRFFVGPGRAFVISDQRHIYIYIYIYIFKRASPIPPTPFLPWVPWWFGECGRGSRKDETRQLPETLFVASASAIWGWHCKRSTRPGPWDMERRISSESSCQRIQAPLVLVTGRDPEEQHISKCFTTCVTLGNQIRNPCAECQLLTEIALLFHESPLHRFPEIPFVFPQELLRWLF